MRRTILIAAKYKDAYRFTLVAGVIAAIFSNTALADERQYKIESAYIYSFFNYIIWPGYDSPQKLREPTICVSGNDPILPYLNYLREKMQKERALTIRTLANDTAPSDCHMLFVRHRISSHMLDTLADNTLVVLKPDDPLDRGGMIELSEDGDRIAIKVDQSQLEKHGFQVSSRLLGLAQGVK